MKGTKLSLRHPASLSSFGGKKTVHCRDDDYETCLASTQDSTTVLIPSLRQPDAGHQFWGRWSASVAGSRVSMLHRARPLRAQAASQQQQRTGEIKVEETRGS